MHVVWTNMTQGEVKKKKKIHKIYMHDIINSNTNRKRLINKEFIHSLFGVLIILSKLWLLIFRLASLGLLSNVVHAKNIGRKKEEEKIIA